MHWRGTAEMRQLRRASDVCLLRKLNASDNIMQVNCAKQGPTKRKREIALPGLCHCRGHAVALCDGIQRSLEGKPWE